MEHSSSIKRFMTIQSIVRRVCFLTVLTTLTIWTGVSTAFAGPDDDQGPGPVVEDSDGERIIINGRPWCRGVGQDTAFEGPTGNLSCVCGDGWQRTGGDNEFDEPECGLLPDLGGAGSSTTPGLEEEPTPPDGGGGTPTPPTRPTLEQCNTLRKQCEKDAESLSESCLRSRVSFYSNNLANGKPCHGQTLEEILDGFEYRVGPFTIDCDVSDFEDIDDPRTDNCRRQAKTRGVGRCLKGVKLTTVSSTASETDTFGFSFQGFSAGKAVTVSRTLSVTSAAGEGGNQFCQELGLKANTQCAIEASKCEVEARGATPRIVDPSESAILEATQLVAIEAEAAQFVSTTQLFAFEAQPAQFVSTLSELAIAEAIQLVAFEAEFVSTSSFEVPSKIGDIVDAPVVNAPADLKDLLKARVDRDRLGFTSDFAILAEQPFKDLTQGDLEILPLYIERLRFLADWSGFLNSNFISDTKQKAVEKIMKEVQSKVLARVGRREDILRALFDVDIRTGDVGTDFVRQIAYDFERAGGVWFELRAGDSKVRTEITDILGDDLGKKFIEKVWPGIVIFTYASPMESGVLVADGSPVTDPGDSGLPDTVFIGAQTRSGVDTSNSSSEVLDVALEDVQTNTLNIKIPGTDTTPLGNVGGERSGENLSGNGEDSYVGILSNPTYTLWNGYLGLNNILELVNRDIDPLLIKVELFSISGVLRNTVKFTLAAGSQRDIILNELSGFIKDSFGVVKITHGGALDGRLFYYKSSTREAGEYDFGFGVAFSEPLQGDSAVGFNTFNPTLVSSDATNVVYNWLSIVNLSDETKRYTINKYNQNGTLLNTTKVSIPAFGRRDLDGGHANPGPNNIGLNKIVPEDPTAPYVALLIRYGTNSQGGYDFAFPLVATSNDSQSTVVPVTTRFGGQNWLEVANTDSVSTRVQLVVFNSEGVEVYQASLNLSPYSQLHTDINQYLEADSYGTAIITASTGGVIAQSMNYFRRADGSISSMYGTQQAQPKDTQIIGTYNLFIEFKNWLRITNVYDKPANIIFTISEKAREYTLPAYGVIEIEIHDVNKYSTVKNSYSPFFIEPTDGLIYAELIRDRPSSGSNIDFIAPTDVR